MIPVAYINHAINGRLRVKIPDKRRDETYFSNLNQQLRQCENVENVVSNPLNGSVLITGTGVNQEKITSYAETQGLFSIQQKDSLLMAVPHIPKPLTKVMTLPVGIVNEIIKTGSNKSIDLGGFFFLSLMSIGIYQVARGNVMLPSWHTAFWYSLGLYSTLIKPAQKA